MLLPRPPQERQGLQALYRVLGAVAGFGPPGRPRASLGGVIVAAYEPVSYEERDCVACLSGLVYDGWAGGWVCCEACSGTGRVTTFVYPKAGSGGRLRECASCRERFAGGRHTHVVDEDHGTVFGGDELRRPCAQRHGVP